MNTINFVETPNSKTQQQVYRWYRVSAFSILSVITLLATINGYQYYQLKTTAAPRQQVLQVNTHIDTLSQRVQKLTEQQEQLALQHNKLAKQQSSSFAPAIYMQEIAAVMPKDSCLHKTELSKKGGMHMSGYTTSAHSLRQFVQKLELSQRFANVHIRSLQPDTATDQALYRFSLTAELQSV